MGKFNKINVVGDPYITKARVDLDFLKIRNKTMDLLEDIDKRELNNLIYREMRAIRKHIEGNLDILIVKK